MDSFVGVERSLRELLGSEYVDSLLTAYNFWGKGDGSKLVDTQVDFYPAELQQQLATLLSQTGNQVVAPLHQSATGAGGTAFNSATRTSAAPLSALGYFRIGESGKLHLVTKSEHYHAPLGHNFPGYQLISHAQQLGIPNATHNNTRGYITRTLEQKLIRTAHGLHSDDKDGLATVLGCEHDLYTLNRVLNLETGSLAVEAALKLCLARFYCMQSEMPEPKYAGRTPVFLVMGNDDGELLANYHGTTVLTQMMRGMWSDIYQQMERTGLWKVVPIRPNVISDLEHAFEAYEQGNYKIAGFFHEIVMMNYGGRLLSCEFLQYAHQLCQAHDVPTVVDEIQSCMWAPELYLFREYGLAPSCVAIGKGFPGGEYPASRLLLSAPLDIMPQFGALVTNGQEELAALAYLITMEWAVSNSRVTAELGSYFESELRRVSLEFSQIITAVDGWRHLTTLRCATLKQAKALVAALVADGLDISAQTYKADCPPVVLTKLPLIADRAMIDFVVGKIRAACVQLESI